MSNTKQANAATNSPFLQQKLRKIEDFDDYKAYLEITILENKHLKGYQTLLAKAASCHPSFISQALNTPVHLTPDHGAGMCQFWAFSQDETEYFIGLVSLARAATPALKSSLLSRLNELKKKKLNLANVFQQPKLEGLQAESLYYSTWVLSAVHVLTSIPKYQQEEAIAVRLNLSLEAVKRTLDKLEEMGLVAKTDRWKATSHSLHLPRESSLLAQHLQNWRQRAILSASECEPSNIHYSAIHALKKSDVEKLRALTLQFLEQTRNVVAPSPEEEIVCVNVDMFVV